MPTDWAPCPGKSAAGPAGRSLPKAHSSVAMTALPL
jgi:hypothetical protein